jgi:RNA-directed DNA polymerase
VIKEFLKERGLELSDEKTLITHIDDGFDFLGWNFRKYGGKLLVKPAEKSIKKVTEAISLKIERGKAWTQETLIHEINPIITGWTNYHRHVVASETFNKLDSRVWNMLWHWAKRRHPKKSKHWIANKYWQNKGNRKWVFSTDKNELKLLSDTKIDRHTKLRMEMNPYLDKDYFVLRKLKMSVKKINGFAEGVWDKAKNFIKPETVTMTNNCCPTKGL